MSLESGHLLAHYEIVEAIGKGGMGEVYRAHDTKLGRDVAIKVLPDEFAQDDERLERFEREARLLAQLNHANVATLHGLEEQDGQQFLVMELVDGETLAERIAQGAIPVEEAIPLFLQIAEGLEAAHEKGIIHRDLKPANIKLTPEGKTKILDFGLAKAFSSPEDVSAETSQSPTLTKGTALGAIMGTAAYMSPEQARGRLVDKRTDIFAFGVVLYESLTGRKAFNGESVSDVLASVIKSDPEWNGIPSSSLERLVKRCLQKDPRQRLRDIGDLRLELEAWGEPNAQGKHSTTRPTLAGLIAVGVICSAVTWAAAQWLQPTETPAVKRLSIVLPPEQRIASRTVQRTRSIAISPDGSHIVFATEEQIYLRAMNRTAAVPLRGTAALQPASPFFSPDGQWVAFYSRRDRELKKIAIGDGVAVTIARTDPIMGATWSGSDTILFGQGPKGIMRVAAAGGDPAVVVSMNSTDGEQARMPQYLPGGRSILFTLASGAGGGAWPNARIVVQDLDSETRQTVIEQGTDARFLPSGHLVYQREHSLAAVSFDIGRLAIVGESLPVIDRVDPPNFSVADDGSLVFVRAPVERRERRLVWIDRDGHEEPLSAEAGFYDAVRISPDGTQVAVVIQEQEHDLSGEIYIWAAVREAMTRLTRDPGHDAIPRWAPDGERLAFTSGRDGSYDGYVRAADGTGTTEQLTDTPNDSPLWSFTGNAEKVVLGDFHPETGLDLHVMAMDGSDESRVLLATESHEWKASLSPDDRWLVYQSDISGRVEVYLCPFPEVDEDRWQLSTEGGTHPVWAPDGREVFYRSPDGQLVAVPIQTEPTVIVGRPSALFDGLIGSTDAASDDHTYDIAPDGKRFLVIRDIDTGDVLAGLDEIHVVLNWNEELERLVPANE